MRIILLLLALLTLMAPARSQDCASLERVRSDVAKFNFPATVTPMDARASASFIAAYNREPPTSNLEGDLVVAISATDKAVVIVVIFSKGCALYTLAFPKAKFINLIAGSQI
jgi:hypothetical protein